MKRAVRRDSFLVYLYFDWQSVENDLSYYRLFSEMSMTSRLDVIIFGATGYTGQYVVEEMARKAQQFGFKWGVAGRTVDKLKQILQQASDITGISTR